VRFAEVARGKGSVQIVSLKTRNLCEEGKAQSEFLRLVPSYLGFNFPKN